MTAKPSYEELERRVQELEIIESDYKHLMEVSQENDSLFKRLYEKAPLGYQSLDENGHFLVVNPTWLDTLGYAKEEVIGKSFAEFLHPDWRHHFKERFPRFKSIGEILGEEFEMVKKNGDLILVSFTGKISRDNKGNFQQTHCIFHDITERKQAEEALRQSEVRFKKMFRNHSAVMLLIETESGVIIDANLAAEKFYGYSHEELQSINISHINTLTPEFIATERHAAREEKRNHFIFPHRLSDGEIRTVEVYSTPITVDNSTLLFSIIHDITERKQAEMLLIHSSNEIKRLDENILNMLRIMSHDIRSPLLSMHAALKLLQRGSYGKMDDSVVNTIKDLSLMASQLLGIADDCLGKALVVDADMKIEKKAIDLRQEVIEAVLEEISNVILSGNITIDNRLGAIPTGAVVVHASKIWLKTVYRNLFMNAIKYGGNNCTIAFGYEDHESLYRFSVYNSGVPIPEDKRSTLFTKFGRVGEEEGQEGIGMGLFLIKKIINKHGGDIWYEAMTDGSIFVFTLPKPLVSGEVLLTQGSSSS